MEHLPPQDVMSSNEIEDVTPFVVPPPLTLHEGPPGCRSSTTGCQALVPCPSGQTSASNGPWLEYTASYSSHSSRWERYSGVDRLRGDDGPMLD